MSSPPTLMAPRELEQIAGLVGGVLDSRGLSCIRASLTEAVPAASPLIFVYDGKPARLADMPARSSDAAPSVIVAPPGSLADFLALRDTRICGHFVADARGLSGLIHFLRSGATSATLMSGMQPEERQLQDQETRLQLLEELDQWANREGTRRSVRASLVEAADELTMNALYDAPVDSEGRQVFAKVTAKDRVTMTSPAPVTVRWGADQHQLAISVEDRFGRLERGTVMRYLERGVTLAEPIENKPMGAGLGLFFIANRASHWFFDIDPGARTTLTCFFDRQSPRPLRGMGFLRAGCA